MWLLGISVVAIRERLFARWVNYLGVVVSVAGLATVVPALEEVGAFFGLGLLIWFTAVGVDLIIDGRRSDAPPTGPRLARAS